MASDEEKRLAKMRKKLAALDKMMRDAGIQRKPYHDLPCDDIKEAIKEGDPNDYARAEEAVDEFQAAWPTIYTHIPVVTETLSFHDIDCQEHSLMDLLWEPDTDYDVIEQANMIFVHTFLEECG